MSVNSHLKSVSDAAIIRDSEKDGIKRSVDTITTRLTEYFGSNISDKFVFGSYSRGTILPRKMDDESDVDLMVVFSDTSSVPQTYLDRLKRFAQAKYSTSEIFQSSPAVVLELNHIKFELVPAIIYSWESNYRIPDKAASYSDWIKTDPNSFNASLTNANQKNNNLIKPLIRVMKYWNTYRSRVYHSFSLEEYIVNKYCYTWNTSGTLWNYFQNLVNNLGSHNLSSKAKEKVEKLKSVVSTVSIMESRNQSVSAEAELKKIIPPVN